MDLLLRRHSEWERRYNCSQYDVGSIPLSARRDPLKGYSLIALGVIIELLYLPCLYAMCKERLRRMACYKLMLVVGMFDVLSEPFTTFTTGYFAIKGTAPCEYMLFEYVIGTFTFAFLAGFSMTSIVLALNRCTAMTRVHFIFNDYINYWVTFLVVYCLGYVWFKPGSMYSPVVGAWLFNPHTGYLEDPENNFDDTILYFNNAMLMFGLPAIYVVFFIHHRRFKKRNATTGMTKRERNLFLQIFTVNLMTCLSACGYVAIQYLHTVPPLLIHASHYGWVIVQGTPPLIYLSSNRSIRNALLSRVSSVNPAFSVSGRKLPSDTH